MSCVVTKKDHNLVLIESAPSSLYFGSWKRVQWCSDCGAIVIDLDHDGRIIPGGIMKMTFPQLAYKEANK